MSTDVKIHLESQDADSVTVESCGISLVQKGLCVNQHHDFRIPLHEFTLEEAFQLDRSRLLKIIGEGAFRIELAKIYVD